MRKVFNKNTLNGKRLDAFFVIKAWIVDPLAYGVSGHFFGRIGLEHSLQIARG